MEKYLGLIKKTKLFEGTQDDELKHLLGCLKATVKSYKKDEFIYRIGDKINAIGLVLDGVVHVINEDYWGNRTILSEFKKGNYFAESYASSPSSVSKVSVITIQASDILFLDMNSLLQTCGNQCIYHNRLIKNLVGVLAKKNILLTAKIEYISKRTTRDKVLTYLSDKSKEFLSSNFEIPFNRQQMADYLCVDRSALSNELSKLQKEGIISYNKQHFELK